MLRSLGAFLFLALVAGAGARAETERAGFLVTAIVPARVTLEAVEHPARLSLSEDDIRRGFKDVSARYTVNQNTEHGWLLRFAPRLGVTRQIEVRGLAGLVVVRDDSVEVYRAGTVAHESLELEYRFILDPEARPGTYEFPLYLSAAPL